MKKNKYVNNLFTRCVKTCAVTNLGIAVFLLAINSFALVDMKSANYTNTWIDMEVEGTGYDLKIVRTYNSRSLYNGIFGFGWCSSFETSIEPTAEGNIKLKECGGGLETLYSPREVAKKDIDATISVIIDKIKADNKVGRPADYYTNLKTQLYEDSDVRTNYAKKYGLKVEIKEGTSFYANGQEVDYFTFNKQAGYYKRTLSDGTEQRYNVAGKQTHVYDKNGNFLKYTFDGTQLTTVEDNNGRRLTFKYYPNKKVKSVTGPNGIMAEYKYTNVENLSAVNNAWKNTFTYEYDDLHNLTKSTWPDKTFISIKYNTKKDWVVAFTDRDKCLENYNYEFSTNDPDNHYWVSAKKMCGKEKVAENRYEFWHKQRSDGQYFLQRVLTEVNGVTTDISYHETFSKPISIRRNSDLVKYEYYQDGLVKTKSSKALIFQYEYDPTLKKVSKVTSQLLDDKGKPAQTKVAQFKYDKKSNLNYAENNDGQKISMSYDSKGRIESILDQAKKVVKIQYEERYGKPAVVTRPGLGTIKISYKPNGEINKVDSAEGPSVALQVASTFNNLLDVIAPATAELYL